MSAFLASNDCLSCLAYYWVRKQSMQSNYSTPREALYRACMMRRRANNMPDDIHTHKTVEEELDAILGNRDPFKVVFHLLLIQNQISLDCRYPGDEDISDSHGYIPQRPVIVDWWISQQQTGHMVGLVQGYEYQACEDPEWEKSHAYQICQQIRQALLRDMERRDCGDSRNWASFEAPQDPRQIAMDQALGVKA